MSFACQHDQKGHCRLLDKPCDPGMKGCVLFGRFTFSSNDSPSNEAVKRREYAKTQKENSSKQ